LRCSPQQERTQTFCGCMRTWQSPYEIIGDGSDEDSHRYHRFILRELLARQRRRTRLWTSSRAGWETHYLRIVSFCEQILSEANDVCPEENTLLDTEEIWPSLPACKSSHHTEASESTQTVADLHPKKCQLFNDRSFWFFWVVTTFRCSTFLHLLSMFRTYVIKN